MTKPQIIYQDDKPAFAVIPYEEYVSLTEGAHLTDEQLYDHAVATDDGDHMPGQYMDRLLEGECPITVYREWRGMKSKDLAAAAELSAGYLSEIEGGKKKGSVDVLKRIATALRVDLDDLV